MGASRATLAGILRFKRTTGGLMAKLGFLGLGIMGMPMARHLIDAGHDVALWSHTRAKADELAQGGKAKVCATPREVAEHSESVFYCVGDTEMSRQVSIGKDGLLSAAKTGMVVADCSTVSPEVSLEIGEAFLAKGAFFLDAPCTGSRGGAEGGSLTFMIGGDQGAFERTRPYFECMGKLFYYCGGPGMGLAAKLTQNLILANIMMAFNEGIVLSTKAGLDPELMLEILNNSAAKSGLIAFKAPYIFARNFGVNFSTKWMHKDVGMALDSGKRHAVPLPLTGVTHQMFQAAISRGFSEDDFCSTIKVLEELTGVEVKKS
jgi:3-hydroxyisobutyrate dehydrogenase/2-hydroxy-3-oxopropionate reductase